MKTERTNGKAGFTMVEIISVLIILGIMVAVAVPKFITLSKESRTKDAKAAVMEVILKLSVAYSKAYTTTKTEPSIADVMSTAGLAPGSQIEIGDVIVVPHVVGNAVSIESISVEGSPTKPAITRVWEKPVQQ